MRAFLKNNRQAPRKVRLVARAVIGKNVEVAVSELSFMPNKAAFALRKLILSAVANAKQKDASVKDADLKIKNITVDKGATYMRYKARAFGRAAPIRRESSHIRVSLEMEDVNVAEEKSKPKEKKKEDKVSSDKVVKSKKEDNKKTTSDKVVADK